MNPYPIRHRFVCHALRILALAVIASIGSVRCVGGDGCPDGKVAVICDPEPE